jgi:putative membrane protein
MMYWGHPVGVGAVLVMVVCMVIFWGGLIALAVWGIRRLVKHSSGSRSNAFDIVRERYAKGEITKEQFEELKKDLS